MIRIILSHLLIDISVIQALHNAFWKYPMTAVLLVDPSSLPAIESTTIGIHE